MNQISITEKNIHIERKQIFNLNYILYQPDSQLQSNLPILLYLHGKEQIGKDLERLKKFWPPAFCTHIPMLIIAPQCPEDSPVWDIFALKFMLDQLILELKADQSRIYLTGVDLGAGSMWELIIRFPNFFAAAVSVRNGSCIHLTERIQIPVWLFHGAKDIEVDPYYSLRTTQDLIKTGLKDVKFSLYSDADQDVCKKVYANQDLYIWLLDQRKSL